MLVLTVRPLIQRPEEAFGCPPPPPHFIPLRQGVLLNLEITRDSWLDWCPASPSDPAVSTHHPGLKGQTHTVLPDYLHRGWGSALRPCAYTANTLSTEPSPQPPSSPLESAFMSREDLDPSFCLCQHIVSPNFLSTLCKAVWMDVRVLCGPSSVSHQHHS